MDDDALLHTLRTRLGPAGVVAPDEAGQRRTLLGDHALAHAPLLRPADTDELAFVLRAAHEAGRPLIPVGGSSGLVRGIVPATGREWTLSLERMRRIERIDPVSRVAVVQAGVVLQALQDAAAAQGLLFAVDLGARGSATVGGLIATNAGGERVLRFGMMREQVLGLEVVLADGRVLDLMDEVLKNNAGYDLKQLFIGSEGTLGIVSRAVLRLRPGFVSREAAFLALPSLDRLPEVLGHLERALGGTLSAFELMWPEFIDTQCRTPGAAHRLPLPAMADATPAGWVLVEAEGGDPAADAARFEAALADLLDKGWVADAALARSEAEHRAFWALRNDIPHLLRHVPLSAAYDVSVPIATMAEYVAELRQAIGERWPDARLVVFGHVADNNLHMGVSLPGGPTADTADIDSLVYAGVAARRGSISAEHGIGLDKREALQAHRPPLALALMRQMKAWLDPNGQLNPDKLVPPAAPAAPDTPEAR